MKIHFVVVLLILLAFSGQAQNPYSMQKLKTATSEDLNVLLDKAIKKRNAGIITTSTGIVVMATTQVLLHEYDLNLETGAVLMITGILTTFVGIPIFITGSTRVKRIRRLAPNELSFELAPTGFYDPKVNKHQLGVTFRLNF